MGIESNMKKKNHYEFTCHCFNPGVKRNIIHFSPNQKNLPYGIFQIFHVDDLYDKL